MVAQIIENLWLRAPILKFIPGCLMIAEEGKSCLNFVASVAQSQVRDLQGFVVRSG